MPLQKSGGGHRLFSVGLDGEELQHAAVAANQGYISEDDIARLIAFRNNPADESWIKG